MTDLGQLIKALIKPLIVEAVSEALAADRSQGGKHAGGLVTMAAFAKAHGIGLSAVRDRIRDGRLEAIKIGRSVRIAADAKIGDPMRPRNEEKPAARAARILALVGAAK